MFATQYTFRTPLQSKPRFLFGGVYQTHKQMPLRTKQFAAKTKNPDKRATTGNNTNLANVKRAGVESQGEMGPCLFSKRRNDRYSSEKPCKKKKKRCMQSGVRNVLHPGAEKDIGATKDFGGNTASLCFQ